MDPIKEALKGKSTQIKSIDNPIEEIERNNLETIIAKEGSKRKRFLTNNLKIGDSLFIEYFLSNIKDKYLNNPIDEEIDIFSLVAMDYYQRFNGTSWNIKKFNHTTPEIIIEFFADILNNKEPINYKRYDEEETFTLPDVESEIVSSVYFNLIKDKKAKNLIRKASNINDLKAILMIDSILLFLKCNKVNEILEYNLNPEQIFITLAKIKYKERSIQNINKYMDEIQKISKEIKSIIKEELTKENAKKLVNFMEKVKIGSYPFEHLRDEEGYTNTIVGRFFEIQEELLNLITQYIDNKTVHALNSINPNFSLSDNIELDIETSKQNLELFERIKKNYEWFKRDHFDLIKFESKIRARKDCLNEIFNKKLELETRLRESDDYSTEIDKIKNETLNQNLAERILEIERDNKKFLLYFKEWIYNHYLAKNVEQLFSISNNCLERIDNKKKQTIEQANEKLNLINTEYELSGNINDDEFRVKDKLKRLDEIREVYKWFEIHSVSLIEKTEKLEQRRNYFLEIRDILKEIEKSNEYINKYLNNIYNYCFDTIFDEEAVRLVHNREINELREKIVSFDDYKEDIYLKVPLFESKKLIETANQTIDLKISQIISEARDRILKLNPDFESTGTMKQDLEISKTQQTMYEKAITIYTLFERSPDELREKRDAISKTAKKYEEIKERWEKIKRDKERIIGYEASYGINARALLDKSINRSTVESINLMFVNIVGDVAKYKEYLKTDSLMFYKDIANYINDIFKIIETTKNKLTNSLEEKIFKIRESINAINNEIDEYNQQNRRLNRIISVFNIPQYIHIKKIGKKLQVYKSELEYLRGINYGNGNY